MQFHDRSHAGKVLAKLLIKYKGSENTFVLAIPRGGLKIGYEISKALGLKLSINVVKKLPHPYNQEYAIGAVGQKDEYINQKIVEVEKIDPEYLKNQIKILRKQVNERYKNYVGGRTPNLKGKTVIICDDGLATGITMMLSVNIIKKQKPKKIIVAIPVAPENAVNELASQVDEVYCPLIISTGYFGAIGSFYESFPQLDDEQAILILKEANKKPSEK